LPDHYEVLGIDRQADEAAIRQAYRRLARAYHPDVNDSPEARTLFEAVQSAYETLSEPLRRQTYDTLTARDQEQRQAEEIRERMRRIREEREAKEAEELRRRAEARRMDHVRPTFDEHEYRALRADVDEMQKLANRGELAAASLLAKRILELDPRQADAYAVQADFALAQGDVRAAATAYAFAAQFAPDNAVYLRQYEALTVAAARAPQSRVARDERAGRPLTLAFATILGLACYLALAREPALVPQFGPLSEWTAGVLMALVVSGFALGLAGAWGGYLSSWSISMESSVQRVGPVVWVLILAPFSFPLCAAVQWWFAYRRRGWSHPAFRLMILVISGLAILAVGGLPSGWGLVGQMLLWGGNVMGIAALLGWALGDVRNRV